MIGVTIAKKEYVVDRDFTYKAELGYFFRHLGRKMMNDIDDASGLLTKLVKFKHASGLI